MSKELVSLLFFSVSALVIVLLSSIGSSTTILAAADEEDFEENSLIKICCTWGKDLADGILTYNIVGDVDDEKKEAVQDAIQDWDD
ncbi:MAG TPA: hypothetical protein VFY64_11015, partial [Nitrososphaeraceae archaeon]|nr:hypothetical protein [Nitrososphaeraceae archaeon]